MLVVISILISLSLFKTDVFANNRDNLREKLNKQEEILEEEMSETELNADEGFIEGLYEESLDELKETIKNSTGTPNFKGKAKELQNGVFNLVINTRTYSIYAYIIIWVVGILYAATLGSRDVNKRRKVYLLIRNSTVIFLTYVNIPLFLIWASSREKKWYDIDALNVLYALLEFLQRNSLVIACLLAFAGITRLIISRNDLPVRRQGIYLIKFSVYLLILLNIAPVAMYFLI